MAKKEKAPVMIDLNVKLASGKTKAAKPDQLSLEDKKIIPVVDKCITIDQQITNLQTELETYEGQIIEAANAMRTEEFEAGNFAKTVNALGTTHKLQIQFKDAYSKMDVSMEAPLQAVFGDKYPIMFKHNVIDTLIDAKKAELKAMLGARWSEFFATEENVQPTKDFQQTYFTLRKSLKPVQLDSVGKILDACQYKPSVKYPK